MADVVADMQQVPEYMSVGSIVLCIENSTKYIVTANHEFHELPKCGGGGGGETDPAVDELIGDVNLNEYTFLDYVWYDSDAPGATERVP